MIQRSKHRFRGLAWAALLVVVLTGQTSQANVPIVLAGTGENDHDTHFVLSNLMGFDIDRGTLLFGHHAGDEGMVRVARRGSGGTLGDFLPTYGTEWQAAPPSALADSLEAHRKRWGNPVAGDGMFAVICAGGMVDDYGDSIIYSMSRLTKGPVVGFEGSVFPGLRRYLGTKTQANIKEAMGGVEPELVLVTTASPGFGDGVVVAVPGAYGKLRRLPWRVVGDVAVIDSAELAPYGIDLPPRIAIVRVSRSQFDKLRDNRAADQAGATAVHKYLWSAAFDHSDVPLRTIMTRAEAMAFGGLVEGNSPLARRRGVTPRKR